LTDMYPYFFISYGRSSRQVFWSPQAERPVL